MYNNRKMNSFYSRVAGVLTLFAVVQVWAISPEIPTLSYDVFTTESIVQLGDLKYRKVEYKGEVFYMRLLEVESAAQDLELLCQQPKQTTGENQVLISTSVTKRSSLFIDGLRQTCREITTGQGKKLEIDPNIQMGFLLDDSKKGWLKNKKVFWNPGKQTIGVGGDF